MKILIYFVMAVISAHFICYFFNVDILECFEKRPFSGSELGVGPPDDEVDDSIDTLTKSLEQLKEITET